MELVQNKPILSILIFFFVRQYCSICSIVCASICNVQLGIIRSRTQAYMYDVQVVTVLKNRPCAVDRFYKVKFDLKKSNDRHEI